MNRFVKLTMLFAIGWNAANAQKTENISLQSKHVTITSSVFSRVEVVDSRLDTSNLGFIEKGGLNRTVFLKTSQPLKDELTSSVINLINGAKKQEGTLLINVRQFRLSQFFGKGGENGVFILSAVFYLKDAAVYRKLLTVNTSVVVKSGWDVTAKLLDTVPEVVGAYVQQAAGFDAAKSDSTTPFTARNWEDLDAQEKTTIPVYNVDMPQPGLYTTYDEFKNNRPSRQVMIVQEDEHEKPLVYEIKENGKKGKEIKFKNFYAVCDGKKMFISGQYTLYPLSKRDNDFYFRSVGKEAGDGSPLVQGQTIIVGRSGNLPAPLNYDWAVIVFKIDHVTGKFIPVRKVED